MTLVDRVSQARHAAKIYAQTKSLRKTAEQMGVSHETARTLVAEAGRDPEA